MTDRELMQMALDALDEDNYMSSTQWKALCRKTCTALRARLAQREQEPVIQARREGNFIVADLPDVPRGSGGIRKEWQGLTDEDLSVCDEDGVILARYWEANLKEKNT